MKLFSKRNLTQFSGLDERRFGLRYSGRRTEIISPETRNRLVSEIKFLSSRNDFLEWFILFENQQKNVIFFDENKVDSFSLSELGYRMSSFFEFETFILVELERKIRISSENERSETYFDDSKLFDLVEITILFAKNKKRDEVIDRFNSILTEENSSYHIVERLITRRTGDTLKSLGSILKDDHLKKKLDIYFRLAESDEYSSAAKLSADILNIIFSGYIKAQKPKAIAEIKDRLCNKLIANKADIDAKKKRLDTYIDDLLKTARNLSNDIYDIRHTEKSTIEVSNDNIYKLISIFNMQIVELVITTLKDDYVLGDSWEKIKKDYIEKYKIDPNLRKTIVKPDLDPPIDLDDIPF